MLKAYRHVRITHLTVCAAVLMARALAAEEKTSDPNDASSKSVTPQSAAPADKVTWRPLIRQSLYFLGIQHAFRVATEPGTRNGARGSYFRGYARAVGNMHGWADGDPFYVNYVGHPVQGGVTNWLWVQNDPRYAKVEFGKNRDYWRSRLRATAFSWAYSTQFEIGPLSEASIGQIQARFPQQGFVDHVVTPALGLGWMLAEDALDKYVIKRIEAHTRNNWVRLLVRGGLNPTRSAANALRGEAPWRRDSRPGVLSYDPATFRESPPTIKPGEDTPGAAPFEFQIEPVFMVYDGRACPGGGGLFAYRMNSQWQLALEVAGCQVSGFKGNISADSLTYLAGPRWRPTTRGRWSPHAHVLVGGQKISQEEVFPEIEDRLKAEARAKLRRPPLREEYATFETRNAFALAAGAGVEVKLNSALAFRLASVDYLKAWTPQVGGIDYSSSIRLSSGIILRLGTW
jgi:hypothetical protein